MNKDKVIKDLKERNNQLANQYRLRDIRCIHLEIENQQLKHNRDKAIKYINEMSGYDVEDYIRQDLLLILKGDSDE